MNKPEPPIELLPCPFCGSKAALYRSTRDCGDCFAHCSNTECEFQPETHLHPNDRIAADRWNTRAQPSPESATTAKSSAVQPSPDTGGLAKKLESKWKPPGIGIGSPLVRLDDVLAVVRRHETDMYTKSPVSLQVDETGKQTSHVAASEIPGTILTWIEKHLYMKEHMHAAFMMSHADVYELASLCLHTPEPVTSAQALDLAKRLRIKSDMIHMGETIAWGSETALMDEAADFIEGKKHVD